MRPVGRLVLAKTGSRSARACLDKSRARVHIGSTSNACATVSKGIPFDTLIPAEIGPVLSALFRASNRRPF